jgi:peroxiredoxin Q/BCP
VEGSGFRDRYGDYQKKNTEIVGVSFDTPAESAAFAEKFDFPFRFIPDIGRTIGLAYGACSSPKEEYARRIAYLIGPDGRIREAHAKVNTSTYPNEQLTTI